MRIAISGTSGFLGSHLVSYFLKQGHVVIPIFRHGVLSGSDSGNIFASESDESLSQQFHHMAVDVLILVGAADTRSDTVSEATLLINGNVLTPTRLLAAAHSAGVNRIVTIGSSWQEQYGDGYQPWDLYAATKQAFNSIAHHYANAGCSIVELQLFDTYGPKDTRAKIYNLMIDAAIKREEIGLSPGDQSMHLVHVRDVCTAVEDAIPVSAGAGIQSLRVDSDSAISVRDLASLIQELVPTFTFALGAREYRQNEIMTPRSRHPRPIGWHPTISLSDGILECILAKSSDSNERDLAHIKHASNNMSSPNSN